MGGHEGYRNAGRLRTLLLDRILPALDHVSRWLALVSITMTAVMIVVTVYEVVARKVFNAPTLWAGDITYMLNGTLFLVGAAFTLRMNGHVRIDFLATLLPFRLQHGINLLFYLVVLLPGLVVIASTSTSKAWTAFVKSEVETLSVWEPLVWPFYTGIAAGFLGLLLQVAIESVRHAFGIGNPHLVRGPSDHIKEVDFHGE